MQAVDLIINRANSKQEFEVVWTIILSWAIYACKEK